MEQILGHAQTRSKLNHNPEPTIQLLPLPISDQQSLQLLLLARHVLTLVLYDHASTVSNWYKILIQFCT